MFSVCSSNACGIPTPNTYFLTGGLVWTGRLSRTSQVSSYSTTGWTQDLPDLTIERQLHACSFYTTDSGEDVGFMLMFLPIYIWLSGSHGHRRVDDR